MALARTYSARLDPRRLVGVNRVWLLTAGMLPIAVFVARVVWVFPAPAAVVRIPLLAFSFFFYVAELTVIHFRFRREAHSFSMSEVPLVLGLFLLAPAELLGAQLLGSAVALGFNRRQPPVKIVFNLSQLSLQTGVATAAFRIITSGGDIIGPRGWIGVLGAVACTLVVSNVLIAAAITISGGRIPREQRLSMVAMSTGAGVMNSALGVVAATIITVAPQSALIAVVPPIVLYFAYRAYMAQRTERDRLQALYQASEELHRLPQIEDALAAAVERARSLFDVESAEVLLYTEGPDSYGYRTAIKLDSPPVVMAPVPPLEPGSPLRLVIESMSSTLTETGGRRGPTGMLAPIPGPQGCFGVFSVAAPLGAVGAFTKLDLKLLETMAGHVGVSLENGRLEDSLARLTELKDELRHQAHHDGLTGLPNRRVLTDRLSQVIARSGKAALLFLDLDDFKQVNDTYGHDVGDRLLIEVASRLRDCCRPADTIARLGGDEFALLLEDLEFEDDAAVVAERIIVALDRPMLLDEHRLEAHASVGVAVIAPGDGPDDVFRAADHAMYVAKQEGKATFRVHGRDSRQSRDLDLVADLRRAIRQSELAIHYQPIVDLVTGEVVALEALARWTHPERGVVPPSLFIPLAEQRGLIGELSEWVMTTAIETMLEWDSQISGGAPMVSVNISAVDLSTPGLARRVKQLADDAGISPSRFQLEITETALMSEGSGVAEELSRHGITIALDDFGTGYSSLAYLDQLPIHSIKIDRSFIARIGESKASTLVKLMIDMAEALGCEAVAEGIETAEQLGIVQRLGCRFGQGYHLGRPAPASEIVRLLEARDVMARV